MKVGIVSFANLRVTPYLSVYTDILEELQVSYEVLYWDRRNLEEASHAPLIRYQRPLDDGAPLVAKLFPMYQYRNFVIKKIKEQKYDFLIILTSLLGVFLCDFLEKKYPNQYLFDIRDYSYESIPLYQKLMAKLMSNSALNVVSSQGFVNFLPLDNVLVCHNISFNRHKKYQLSAKDVRPKKLLIGFVGVVRYYQECLKFIEAIKNDSRIQFCFYGEGEDEARIKQYCDENNIKNVKFFGSYQPDEKEKIIESLDLIYNAYGNGSPKVKYALSNKCYDAAWYKKGLIVNAHTLMAETTAGYSYAISDDEKNLAENLVNWYTNINWTEFDQKTHKIIEKAFNDNQIFTEKVKNLLQ